MAYSKTTWTNGSGQPINASNLNKIENELAALDTGKQDKLVSGSNIATINNQSLLDGGNITIEGGGGSTEILTSNGSKSVSSGTSLAAISKGLALDQGIYIVFASARFPSLNARACVQIYADTTGDGTYTAQGVARQTGYSNSALDMEVSVPIEITVDGGGIKLYGWQNKGSAVTADWYLRAVKIA